MISRNSIATAFAFSTLVTVALPMDRSPALLFTNLYGHTDYLRSLTNFTLQDKHYAVSGSQDKTVRVWDLETNQSISTYDGWHSTVRSLCCMNHGDDVYIIGGGGSRLVHDKPETPDPIIILYSFKTRGWMGALEGHTDDVNGICAINEKTIASCSYDGTVRIWDLEGMKCSHVFGQENKRFLSISRLDDERLACSYIFLHADPSNAACVDILNHVTGEIEHTFVWNEKGSTVFLSIADSKKLMLLTSTLSDKYAIFNWDTGEHKDTLVLPGKYISQIVPYDSKQVVFVAMNGNAWICNCATGQEVDHINLGFEISFFEFVGDQFVYANNALSPDRFRLCVAKNPLS